MIWLLVNGQWKLTLQNPRFHPPLLRSTKLVIPNSESQKLIWVEYSECFCVLTQGMAAPPFDTETKKEKKRIPGEILSPSPGSSVKLNHFLALLRSSLKTFRGTFVGQGNITIQVVTECYILPFDLSLDLFLDILRRCLFFLVLI